MRSSFKSKYRTLREMAMPILLFALIVGALLFGIQSTSRTTDAEQLKTIQRAIKKATVQCYAIEGIYPPSISYLKEHYGIIVDEEQYFVLFDSYASNMMPDIQVFQKG